MGDRVAIIGGQTVGRDHFPFAVPDYTTAAIAGQSLATIARWFYNVKTWQLDGTIDISVHEQAYDEDGVLQDYSIDATHSLSAPISGEYISEANFFPVTRESDLVRQSDCHVVALSDVLSGTWSDSTAAVGTAEQGITIFDAQSETQITYGSGLFYPEIIVDLLITLGAHGFRRFGGGTLEDAGVELVIHLSTDSSVGALASSLTIDGVDVTIYADVAIPSDEDLPLFVVDSWDCDIFIDPSEFWPYAARDTTPIYNTSTGSQLQSPFN